MSAAAMSSSTSFQPSFLGNKQCKAQVTRRALPYATWDVRRQELNPSRAGDADVVIHPPHPPYDPTPTDNPDLHKRNHQTRYISTNRPSSKAKNDRSIQGRRCSVPIRWNTCGCPATSAGYPARCRSSFEASITTRTLSHRIWPLPLGRGDSRQIGRQKASLPLRPCTHAGLSGVN